MTDEDSEPIFYNGAPASHALRHHPAQPKDALG